MLRTVLVVIHAGAGIGGLIAGLPALSPPRPDDGRGWARRLYAVLIGGMLAALVAMVAIGWGGHDTGARIAFSGLTGLGAVMAYRLARAHREASSRGSGWQARYIDHVYFTYVSLWIGFLIVPALNVPRPEVAVPAVVIAVLAGGHVLLARFKRRLAAASAQPPDR